MQKPLYRYDISLIRIFCTVAVVLSHISKYYMFVSFARPLEELLGGAAVECFFIISGFLVGRKQIVDLRTFVLKRIYNLWFPVAVMSLLIIIINTLIYGERYDIITVICYLGNLQGLQMIIPKMSIVIGYIDNLSHLWFMTVIVLCTVLIPGLQEIKAKMRFDYIVVQLGILYFALFVIQWRTGILVLYGASFIAGYYLDEVLKQLPSCKVSNFVITVIVLYLSRIVFRMVADETYFYHAYVKLVMSLSSLILIISIIRINDFYSTQIERLAQSRIGRWINQHSLYIYMTHYVFCMGKMSVYSNFTQLPATALFCLFTIISSALLRIVAERGTKIISCKKDNL